MLKSMMQPPESKLSSGEIFVLILMPVFLIGNGSRACSMRTFEMLTWTLRTISMEKMNQEFLKTSVAPLLSSPVSFHWDSEGGTHLY